MSEHADTIRRVLVDVREKQLREDEMRIAAVEALISLDALVSQIESHDSMIDAYRREVATQTERADSPK